jgi:hypothetical protein
MSNEEVRGMDKLNNTTNTFEFEFQEEISPAREEMGESAPGEFEEAPEELVDKSEVFILTDNYVVRGKISLVPGARLTDYIVEANLFIAVTDVEVKDKAGNLVLTSPFLNIHRDRIEIILPSELANMAEIGS